jgi:hypothetical protein
MVVKPADGLESCDVNSSKMAADLQRSSLSVDGQKSAITGLQTGRITADCLEGLKFFIENTNWYLPASLSVMKKPMFLYLGENL